MEQATCKYKNCNKVFNKTRKDKVYCSRRCKSRASDLRNGRSKKRVKALRNNNPSTVWRYKKFRKDHCEQCGFIPEHMCQLDVDHIDGDKLNHDKSNLQTLCANCHRLKTYVNKDWKNKIMVN